MKNLRSVGGLLAISAAFSCATAINDDTVPGQNTPPDAGSDFGGGAGLAEVAGGPAAGGSAPHAGAGPASAGKGGSSSGGTGTGTGGKGGGSAGSAGKGGSGGTVSAGGSSGSSSGGKAGTSSSGAGGSSAGSTGTAGGGSVGLCDNPVDVAAGAQGNTGNFNTLEAKCFRTKSTFNNIACSNFEGRTLKVNGVATKCDPALKGTFAPTADGYTYLDASAGTNPSASVYWYTS
jgi:hypothetical protein